MSKTLRKGHDYEYKIQWRGYTGPDAIEWIKEGDNAAEELIEDFHMLNPSATRRAERVIMVLDRTDLKRTEALR
jgi:hypothetical protein